MAQVATGTAVHDVVVIGSGAGGGTVTKVLADLGVTCCCSRPGRCSNMADLKEHMWPYQVPHRGAGREGPGLHRRSDRLHLQRDVTAARSSRASPTPSRPAATSRWFRSRILGGRTNHYGRVTLRYADYDFKPQLDRRPRLRLADRLRGPGALLRQGGALHRRHRHDRGDSQRARRHLPHAGAAAGARRPGAARVREAGHPCGRRAAGGHRPSRQRPAGVPLLRPVRPRLHDGVELRRQLRADLPGDEDRQACR